MENVEISALKTLRSGFLYLLVAVIVGVVAVVAGLASIIAALASWARLRTDPRRDIWGFSAQ